MAPELVGFLSGLTILGALITTIAGYLVKKFIVTQIQNDDLKTNAIKADIKSSRDSVELLIESVRGDFKALEAKVVSGLNQFTEQNERFNRTVQTIKTAMIKIDLNLKNTQGRVDILEQDDD